MCANVDFRAEQWTNECVTPMRVLRRAHFVYAAVGFEQVAAIAQLGLAPFLGRNPKEIMSARRKRFSLGLT